MRRFHLARSGLWVLCLSLLLITGTAGAVEHHGQVMFDGLPVPGATVTMTQGQKRFSTTTDQQGLYEFADLPGGIWAVRIEISGFEPVEGTIKVEPNAPQGMWELKMLGLDQMITQTKAARGKPLMQRDTSSAASSTGKRPEGEVPMPEAPKPQDDAAAGAADGLLINGSENNAATSKYSMSQAFGNHKVGPKAMYTGGIGIIVGNSALDARPYSITGLALPKATYNRITGLATLGGPLNIKPLWYQGPNFFLAYQWTRDTNASTAQGLVPDAAQRNGDLSGMLDAQGRPITIYDPVTKLPFVGPLPVSPQARALLALYPFPNLQQSSGLPRYNYQTQVLTNEHIDALQSRLDKTIGHKDQVYGRFGFQSVRSDAANLFHFRDTTNTLGLDGSANWSHRYLHQVFVNLGYHFTRFRTQVRPQFANIDDIEGNAGITGVSSAARDWGPPALNFSSGISGLSDGESEFNRNRTDAGSLSVQTTRRRHNFTFGGDFRRQEFNELAQSNPRGTFAFTGAATAGAVAGSGSDLADFLLGSPSTAQLAFGNADKYFRQSVYDAYFSDDWRLQSTLTIVAGVRWDYGAPLRELFGRLVNLDVTPGFAAAAPVLGSSPKGSLTGQSYTRALIRPDRQSFEPRVGISWRPFPASTMVVRAGYGVYDDTSVYLATAEAMAQQSPLSKSVSAASSATCPLTLANGFVNCAGTTTNTFAVDPNLRVGYAQTWQLSVQRDLPAAMVGTLTYLGVKGTRGMQEFLPNSYPIGGVNPCPSCPSGFVYRTSNGNSTRQSAQVQLRRRLRSGITASVDYIFSKSLDDDAQLGAQGHVAVSSIKNAAQASTKSQGSPMVAQNWRDLRAERGLSTFDQRHLIKVTAQYTTGMGVHGGTLMEGFRGTLFKQWTLSAVLTAGSGLPETPVYFATVPGTGFTGPIRPDLTGAPIYEAAHGYFLNAAAYTAPLPGQWGTARRNSITGPGVFSFDSSLSRTFSLRMPFYLDVKLDATNLLNHVTYSSWNTTVNSTTFGLPATANAMRSVQITGRLRF
ncbi:MAG TPA: carboxypeptidase-like regulatory domain-containing protein [Edaphobacter sp.]|nr:carboxypeptidase-like regulatory domain-containing protein [Edaphobacter sp.]